MLKESFRSIGRLAIDDRAIPYIGQGLAQIPKTGISMLTTDLGAKIINTAVGAFGNLLNEYLSEPESAYKKYLREICNNMMWSWADPTMQVLRSIRRSVTDLFSGLRMHNFSASFGSLVEEPGEIIREAKSWISMIKNAAGINSLSGFRHLSTRSPTGYNKTIKSITPKVATTYENFGSKLTEKDLVSY